MKVRIGGVLTPSDDLKQIENQITNTIVDQVVTQAFQIGPRFLRRLKQRIQIAATQEAERIFQVIVALMDRQQRGGEGGFGASALMSGVEVDPIFKPRALASGGTVNWIELSYRYAMSKSKGPNRYRFFRKSNAMRNYFSRQGSAIVRSRFGGIQVDVDMTPDQKYVSGGNHKLVSNYRVIDPEEVRHKLLGRVSATIFPRLGPSMLPMLSTRRWTSDNGGAMERSVFSGTRTAEKLLNRRNKHRPLVTPVVQFFMLVRIPNAIRANIANYLGRTGIRGD